MKKADAELKVKFYFRQWFEEVYPTYQSDWHSSKISKFPHWLNERHPELFDFRTREGAWEAIRGWGLQCERGLLLEWSMKDET